MEGENWVYYFPANETASGDGIMLLCADNMTNTSIPFLEYLFNFRLESGLR